MRKLNTLFVVIFFYIIAPVFAQTEEHQNHQLWQIKLSGQTQLLEWDSSGEFLAIANESKIIILDAKDGNSVKEWTVDNLDVIKDLDWSFDSRFLVTLDTDGQIIVWDASSPNHVTSFIFPYATSVSWHPSKYQLIVASDSLASTTPFEIRQISIWDISNIVVPTDILDTTNLFYSVEYSSDGLKIAGVTWEGFIRIWDSQTGNMLYDLTTEEHFTLGDQQFGQSLVWSPEDKELAVISNDNLDNKFYVSIWDIQSQKIITQLKGHTAFIHSLSWNSNNNLIATASGDGEIRIWDFEATSYVLDKYDDLAVSVSWSPDGEYLASASRDGTVSLWEIDISANE